MVKKRKCFKSVFKRKIALEMVKGACTVTEIGSRHGIYPNRVR